MVVEEKNKLKALSGGYTNHPPYIQNTYVYTLDLNALNITATMAMEHKWSHVNTFVALGNTRVSSHT